MHEPGPRGRQDRVNRLALAACAVRYIRVAVEVRPPSGSVSVSVSMRVLVCSWCRCRRRRRAESKIHESKARPCQRPVLPYSAARLSYSGGVGGCPTSTRGKLQGRILFLFLLLLFCCTRGVQYVYETDLKMKVDARKKWRRSRRRSRRTRRPGPGKKKSFLLLLLPVVAVRSLSR